MHAIKQFVLSTSLSDSMKEELVGDKVMQRHALYLQLPTWLAPLFKEVNPEQVEQLGFGSYFYFRFLLVIDSVLDAAPAADTTTAPAGATERLLTYTHFFEQSVRTLATLFPQKDPFWGLLDYCKQQYAESNVKEKVLSAERGTFTLEMFEGLAADKSAVCNAIVYALSRLGGDTQPVEALLGCLKHLHIGLQCMDDEEDFRQDWEQHQYTYAHALLEEYLTGEGIDPRSLDVQSMHSYFYSSGTADKVFALGQEHFAKAIAHASALGLSELTARLEYLSSRCDFYRADIVAKLARFQERTAVPVPLAA